MAFYLAVNVEYFPPGRPAISLFGGTAALDPDPLNHGWRDYGARVGIWRVMDVLDERALRPSAPLNAAVCEHHPEIVAAGTKRDWCWIAHGEDNATLHTDLNEDEERAALRRMITRLEGATGQRPNGWLGPACTETIRTPQLLVDLGFSYVMDWCNDDAPYPLSVRGGPLIALPYLIEVGDIAVFLLHGRGPDEFAAAVIDHFDRLYEEGAVRPAVMGLGIHPFLIGQPGRVRGLERALDHVLSRPDVWVATSDEIARWYLDSQGKATVHA